MGFHQNNQGIVINKTPEPIPLLATAQVYHLVSPLQDHRGHHNYYFRIAVAINFVADNCRPHYYQASKSTISKMFPFPYIYLELSIQYFGIPIQKKNNVN